MTDPDQPTNPHLSSLPDDQTTIVPSGLSVPPPPPTGSPAVESAADRSGGRVYGGSETYVSREIYGASRQATPTDAASDGPVSAARSTPLPGADRGSTSIDPEVVERVIRKIVNLTVDDVDGVDGLYESADDDDPEAGRPVSVILDGDDAQITIAVRVQFGHAVHQVVEQLRSRVVTDGERLLGLNVSEVNVRVADVVFESGS